METLDLVQGSPQWLEVRAKCFTASEAPAMMGTSKYQTRSALLKQKSTGMAEDIDASKQALFDRGHKSEADARPLAEAIIGSDLYPVTATLTIDGIDLLASLDGAVMMEDEIFEHKLYSESLAADVRNCTLDPHYTIQMDQQLLVTGAKRCLFMTSNGTTEKFAWCWYESSQEKFDALIAGWKQFAADLAEYQHIEAAPVPVAEPVESLPAVSVQMNGSIAIISNLDLFGSKLRAFVANLDQSPSDDQAFANAEAAVKTLKGAEDALERAESSALAQTESIEQMRTTVGLYRDIARTARLSLEKLVKARKETIRIEITNDARQALRNHIAALNKRLGAEYVTVVAADFGAAVKNKRTLESLRDATNTELVRAKILANEIADRIQINLATLRELAADYTFLFSDTTQIVTKNSDDLAALVKLRIAEHKFAEEKKETAQRERILAEEVAKLAQAEAARVKAEQDAQAQAQAAIVAAQAVAAPAIQPAPAMRAFGNLPVTQAQFDKTYPPAKLSDRAKLLAAIEVMTDEQVSRTYSFVVSRFFSAEAA